MHTDSQVEITNQNQTFSHLSSEKKENIRCPQPVMEGSKCQFKSWRKTPIFCYQLGTIFRRQFHTQSSIRRLQNRAFEKASFVFRHFQAHRNSKGRNIILEEVKSLLEKNAIEIVDPQNSNVGFYSTIFIVPKQSGGFQAILNLRKLNKFIKNQHFKMKTLRSVIQSLNAGDWAFSKDLSDAYLQVLIHSGSRKFLRFAIEGTVYQYRGLPFGISVAPCLFTKK